MALHLPPEQLFKKLVCQSSSSPYSALIRSIYCFTDMNEIFVLFFQNVHPKFVKISPSLFVLGYGLKLHAYFAADVVLQMPFIEGCVMSNEDRCKRALFLTLACLSEGTSVYIKAKYVSAYLTETCC